jgi:hypothetical protein
MRSDSDDGELRLDLDAEPSDELPELVIDLTDGEPPPEPIDLGAALRAEPPPPDDPRRSHRTRRR